MAAVPHLLEGARTWTEKVSGEAEQENWKNAINTIDGLNGKMVVLLRGARRRIGGMIKAKKAEMEASTAMG